MVSNTRECTNRYYHQHKTDTVECRCGKTVKTHQIQRHCRSKYHKTHLPINRPTILEFR